MTTDAERETARELARKWGFSISPAGRFFHEVVEMLAAARRETAERCAEACEAVAGRAANDEQARGAWAAAAACRAVGLPDSLTHGAGWRDPEA